VRFYRKGRWGGGDGNGTEGLGAVLAKDGVGCGELGWRG
jgi:hypothetical protein